LSKREKEDFMSEEMKPKVAADQGELAESDLDKIAGGAPATTTTASGNGSGRTTVHDLNITKYLDLASPK
jgi:hypothetical protein